MKHLKKGTLETLEKLTSIDKSLNDIVYGDLPDLCHYEGMSEEDSQAISKYLMLAKDVITKFKEEVLQRK